MTPTVLRLGVLLPVAAALLGCASSAPTEKTAGQDAMPAARDGFAPVTDAEALLDRVEGRELRFPNGSVATVRADGSLVGRAGARPFAGIWRFEGERFCRTLVFAGRGRPEDCHHVAARGDRLRLTAPDGAPVVEAAIGPRAPG
ncbi:MAG: hypothetical protein ACFBWO_13505 [Paracoccaceae bacterium]